MSRGRNPVVAIGEAKRKAQAQGFVLIIVDAEIKLPFDFVISDMGCISLVRVRRLKYSDYRIAEIERLCDREIAEMRDPRIPEEIFRELWVRGPDRHWHRYLVLKGTIEALESGDDRFPDDDSPANALGERVTQAGEVPGITVPESGAPAGDSPDTTPLERVTPTGDVPGNEPGNGGSPGSNPPEGNAPDGRTPVGKVQDSEAADGDLMECDAPADPVPQGGTPDGDSAGGEATASPFPLPAYPPAVQEPAPGE